MAQISPGVLVLVFFVYGLAWFVMGLAVALGAIAFLAGG